MTRARVDVAIVGAGLSGLAAARHLLRGGLTVRVLEARRRVGGRVFTERLDDGTPIDLGGQWIGPTQTRITSLLAELGVGTFPTYDTGDNLVLFQRRARRYRGAIPRLAPHLLADIGQAQFRLDRLAKTVPLDAPWEAPNARSLDERTLATWLERNVLTDGARKLLRIGLETVLACDPADVSLLHALFYIHAGRDVDTLINVRGGAQETRIVGGMQPVAEHLAAALDDGLSLGAPVRRIRHGERGATVFADGLELSAERVIVAIPPTLAGRIAYDPPLPGHRDQLTQRMPQGSVIKVHVIYERPFWRDEGLSGQLVSDEGPLHVTFDGSPPEGRPGILTGFLEGRAARAWGQRTQADRRNAILEGLARAFGPRAGAPLGYRDIVWADEEWTRGCYVASMPPGAWTDFGTALRRPIGPIHWAGTETAGAWNGYFEGALAAGERAAEEVLAARRGGREA